LVDRRPSFSRVPLAPFSYSCLLLMSLFFCCLALLALLERQQQQQQTANSRNKRQPLTDKPINKLLFKAIQLWSSTITSSTTGSVTGSGAKVNSVVSSSSAESISSLQVSPCSRISTSVLRYSPSCFKEQENLFCEQQMIVRPKVLVSNPESCI